MDCPKCGASTPDTQSFCGKCGANLQPAPAAGDAADASDASTRFAAYTPEALESGTTFAGRYQIIEELGRGGMGRVYKVIDNEVHAKVALKLIRPEIAYDQATIERFRQELKTARAISHKNICRLHDLGRDGTTYFLTMEYVSGEDLKSMIGMSGQLGVGTAISIAKQVCDGLAEAHRLGVIHRDLKPQNIQIDKGGQAKIMDFGIARAAVADLERAVAMLPYQALNYSSSGRFYDEQAGVLDLLARAYEVAGDLAKARETYEKITTLTSGRLAWGATYARAFYHLGVIAEQQGDKARAHEHFGKFLDLWKNADPGQREVADAKKRMRQ